MSLPHATLTRTATTAAASPDYHLTEDLASVVTAVQDDIHAQIAVHLHNDASGEELLGVMVSLCPTSDTLVADALFTTAVTWPVTGQGVTARELNTHKLATEIANRIISQL